MNYKIITTSLLFIVSCMANDTKASVVAEDKKTEQTKPQSEEVIRSKYSLLETG